ncbi:MAG TPA: hypothetical protein VN861_03160 [Candidatus Acidoferrales bacterium]|nr:hypothetical protein [Candidatus Acidoferrales bacterium]
MPIGVEPKRKWSLESFIVSNIWRLECKYWFKRRPDWIHPLIGPSSECRGRFLVFMFRWRQSCWWPPFWGALFRFDEEYDPKTRGWRVAIIAIPLFAFSWQFRYPAFDSLCVETSMWVSALPGMPDPGAIMPSTYRKVWMSTRLTDYRSWEEAARHHV